MFEVQRVWVNHNEKILVNAYVCMLANRFTTWTKAKCISHQLQLKVSLEKTLQAWHIYLWKSHVFPGISGSAQPGWNDLQCTLHCCIQVSSDKLQWVSQYLNAWNPCIPCSHRRRVCVLLYLGTYESIAYMLIRKHKTLQNVENLKL